MALKHSKQEIKKVMEGYEKDAHLDKKKKMIIKITQDVRGKPQRRDTKPQFEQECNILDRLSLYYVSKGDQFYNTPILIFYDYHHILSFFNIELRYYMCAHSKMGVDNFVVLQIGEKN